MHAEVRQIRANDVPDWPRWSPSGSEAEFQWFTLAIGPEGDARSDSFQVAVATWRGLRERRHKDKFVGLVVDRFEPEVVEQAIREFVAARQSPTWEGIVDLLRSKLLWEYDGYRA
jgi:hypothetical protein